MKIQVKGTICCFMVVGLLVMGTAGIYAQGQGSGNNAFLNGKPFAALSGQIQTNADAIAGLETQTAALEDELAQLKGNLDALEARLFAAESNITAINGEIGALNSRIGAVEAEMEDIAAEILRLGADDSANADAIAELEGRLDGLRTLVLEGHLALAQYQSEIRAELDGLGDEIDELQLQLTEKNEFVQAQVDALKEEIRIINELNTDQGITLTELVANIATLNLLQGDVSDLQGDVTDIIADILQLQSDMDELIAGNAGAIEGHVAIRVIGVMARGNTRGWSISCPTGKTVLSGGIVNKDRVTSNSDWKVNMSGKVGNGWKAIITNISNIRGVASYYLICAFAAE